MRESGSDIDNWTIGGIGLITAAVVAAVVLFLQALVYRWQAHENERKTVTPIELRDYRAEQTLKLNEYAWVDRSKGLVRIPIDVAKGLIVAKARERNAAAVNEAVPPAGSTAEHTKGSD